MELVNFLFWLLPIGLLVSIIYHFNYKLPRTEPSITDFHKTKSRLKFTKYIFYGLLGSLLLLGINNLLEKNSLKSKKEGIGKSEIIDGENEKNTTTSLEAETINIDEIRNSKVTPDEFVKIIKGDNEYIETLLSNKGCEKSVIKDYDKGIIGKIYKLKNWKDTSKDELKFSNSVFIHENSKDIFYYLIYNEQSHRNYKDNFKYIITWDMYANFEEYLEDKGSAYLHDSLVFIDLEYVERFSAYTFKVFHLKKLKTEQQLANEKWKNKTTCFDNLNNSKFYGSSSEFIRFFNKKEESIEFIMNKNYEEFSGNAEKSGNELLVNSNGLKGKLSFVNDCNTVIINLNERGKYSDKSIIGEFYK